MKKEVQALINRRRARTVPYIFLGLVGLVCFAIAWLTINFFTTGAGRGMLQTSTPTPTITPTPPPPTATLSPTPTAQFSPTPTNTSGPSPTPAPTTYIVLAGDSLFGISTQFGVNLCDLMSLNGITDPAFLGEGATLTIPSAGYPPPTATPLPADQSVVQYFVCPGDSLDVIASKFNSLVDDITRRNNLTDPNALQVGQILDIKINLATPTPTPEVTPTATP